LSSRTTGTTRTTRKTRKNPAEPVHRVFQECQDYHPRPQHASQSLRRHVRNVHADLPAHPVSRVSRESLDLRGSQVCRVQMGLRANQDERDIQDRRVRPAEMVSVDLQAKMRCAIQFHLVIQVHLERLVPKDRLVHRAHRELMANQVILVPKDRQAEMDDQELKESPAYQDRLDHLGEMANGVYARDTALSMEAYSSKMEHVASRCFLRIAHKLFRQLFSCF
ncbi:hypothetical protein OESDEN_11037, partial [Oesophagostomum dentatum]